MVGGFQTFYNLLPFLVEIVIKPYGQSPNYICSGSLITYDIVLTAAHCLRNNSIYFVGVGGTNKSFIVKHNGRVEFLSGQTRLAGAIYKHEDFDPLTAANDIGFIKVFVPFNHQTTSLAPLPQNDEKVDLADKYKYCFLGGFGSIGDNNILTFDKNKKQWVSFHDPKYSEKVVYLTVPLISNKQCRRIWNSDTIISFRDVTSSQICTLYYPGRKSHCFGDSGGPLLCGSSQYGIVSNSYSCGHARIGANVYTRVDKYLNWINDSLNKVKIIRTEKELEELLGYNGANCLSFFTVLMFNYVLVCFLRKI